MMTFGSRLRANRIDREVTQEQLATAAGVTDRTLRDWERGRTQPRLDQIRALAKRLGVSVASLIKPEEGAQ